MKNKPTTKADEFTYEKFLTISKKQTNVSIEKQPTKAGNHKIRYDNKIVSYLHQGKLAPVILWNKLISKNQRISNEKEVITLFESLPELK